MLMIKRKDAMLMILNTKVLVNDLNTALKVYKEFNSDPVKITDDILNAEKGNIVSDAGIVVELKESFTHIALGLKGEQTKSVAKQKGLDKLKYVISTILNQLNGFTSILDIVTTQIKVTKDNFLNVSENLAIEGLKERINIISSTGSNKEFYLKRVTEFLAGTVETTATNKLNELKGSISPLDLISRLKALVTADIIEFQEALNDKGHSFEDFLVEYKNKLSMVHEEYKSKELLPEDKLIKEPDEQEIENKSVIELVKADTTSDTAQPNGEYFTRSTLELVTSLEQIIKLTLDEVNSLINKFNFNLPSDKLNLTVLTKVLTEALDESGKDMLTPDEFNIKTNNIMITVRNLCTLDEHLTDVAIHKLNIINSILTTYQQVYDLVVEITNLGYAVQK